MACSRYCLHCSAFDASGDYKTKRRAVLVRTFDELLEHALRAHPGT